MNEHPNGGLPLLDGRFQLESLIGRGGMAEVYRARDLRQGGRHVAIKILRNDVVDSVGVERFRREIALTSEFTHPHILGLFESGETTRPDGDTMLFYVMPLVEGETLRERLAREDHLPLHDVVRITREVLEALRYAHEHGVIHRDIKPANILLSGGHAVVADFGIARPIPNATAEGSTPAPLTVSGVAVGTPAYMSPEQAFATATVDARCDLYAAGCVFYEMLTGQPPFEASTGQAIMARKMAGVFVPPSVMRPGLPVVIDEITAIALRPDPADRFANAAAFLDALSHLGEAGPMRTTTERSSASSPPAWRRRATILGTTVLAVSAIGAWLWSRSTAGPSGGDVAIDPARIAILPFENLSADTSLSYVAKGITADLIDQLAQVRALTVVSKDGVRPFEHVSLDSLARALRVGTIVTGDVRQRGDKLSVSVRLIDGRTARQLASRDTASTPDEVLAMGSSVIEDVSRFLRERLGEQVRISTSRRRASSAEAWELVERVRELREGALKQTFELSPVERARRFQRADSLAVLASRLDKRWAGPTVERALLAINQATIEEEAGLAGVGSADSALSAARHLWRRAVQLSDESIARDMNEALAFRIRGVAHMELWRTSRDRNDDSLRVLAEADLRSAVEKRPDLATAWNDLSNLLNLSGDFAAAEQAAAEALRVDEYLTNAPTVLARLQAAALGADHTASAIEWCDRGRSRYPNDERFFACELTTLGWTADRPEDVSRAWRILDGAEQRYSSGVLNTGWSIRRFLVAAVAARAGLRDSAKAIISRTRAQRPQDSLNVAADFVEAHVRALLGQRDQGIFLLKRYLTRFPYQRRRVARTSWFRSLRDDPRFIEMTSDP